MRCVKTNERTNARTQRAGPRSPVLPNRQTAIDQTNDDVQASWPSGKLHCTSCVEPSLPSVMFTPPRLPYAISRAVTRNLFRGIFSPILLVPYLPSLSLSPRASKWPLKSSKAIWGSAVSSPSGENNICSQQTRFMGSKYTKKCVYGRVVLFLLNQKSNKMLSYRRETALQGAL